MNNIQIVLLFFFIAIFSWPILANLELSIWTMWLYPFVIWIGLVFGAWLLGSKHSSE